MSSLLQDLHLALRGFLRTPSFALIAIITLGVGIGANTAIFSVLDSVILRPLPYPDSGALVILEQQKGDSTLNAASWPDFADWRDDNQAFSAVAAYTGDSLILNAGGGRPAQLNALSVTANYLSLLGVRPALGRDFVPGEDTDGKNRVVIFTHAAWKKHLAADPGVVGRTVTIDDQPFTVIGVMPESFRLVESSDVAAFVPKPRSFDRELAQVRGARFLQVMARLKPGLTLDEAQANMTAIGARIAAAYPETNTGRSVKVTRMHDRLTKELRPALWILLAAVGLVLLIACANVANLLLARASSRHRELAIRVALGASRGRVVRQMLSESVLLAVLGGALGVALALWGLDALKSVIPDEISRLTDIRIDGRILAFTMAVSLVTGLAFGLLPALQAAGANASDALKEASVRTTSHAGRQRARNTFVAAEIALATLLLVGASLMLRSFQRVNQVDPGFHPDHLTVGWAALPATRYDSDEKIAGFYHSFREKLAGMPGSPPFTVGVPLPYSDVGMSFKFDIVGQPPLPPGKANVSPHFLVSPDYFAVLGIPIVAGRTFSAAEDRIGGPPVVMVNQALARTFFPGESPLGKRVMLGWREKGVEREIVGVVGDVRGSSLETAPSRAMYVPFGNKPWNIVGFVVRSEATTGMGETLQAGLSAVDAEQPLTDLTTMGKMMKDTLAKRRLNTLLLVLFGAVAMLLALIGVYGVMSYTVTQRVPEIGIRIALGAQPGGVTRMVVGQGLILAGIGVAVGLVGAFALARLLQSLLYGVSPTDPLVYAGTAVLLLGIAALASFLPARRASRVDPMIALRSE